MHELIELFGDLSAMKLTEGSNMCRYDLWIFRRGRMCPVRNMPGRASLHQHTRFLQMRIHAEMRSWVQNQPDWDILRRWHFLLNIFNNSWISCRSKWGHVNDKSFFFFYSCQDVDECQDGTHNCKSSEVCRNRPGNFVCDCPAGYERNYTLSTAGVCEDIDECTGYRKYQVCSRSSECENTVGSYVCTCTTGFKQSEDGRTCVGGCQCNRKSNWNFEINFRFDVIFVCLLFLWADKDECTEVDNICQQKCVNIWGSYHCTCDTGYKLNPDKRWEQCSSGLRKNVLDVFLLYFSWLTNITGHKNEL